MEIHKATTTTTTPTVNLRIVVWIGPEKNPHTLFAYCHLSKTNIYQANHFMGVVVVAVAVACLRLNKYQIRVKWEQKTQPKPDQINVYRFRTKKKKRTSYLFNLIARTTLIIDNGKKQTDFDV